MKDCPICGARKLVTDTRDVPVSYLGHQTAILSVSGEYCDGCGEIIFDIAQAQLYSQKTNEFVQSAKLSFVRNNNVKK